MGRSRRRIIRPPKIIKEKIVHLPRNQFEVLRRSLNLTQEQFGEKLGVTKQCINYYEMDRSFPTVKNWHSMKDCAKQHNIELSDDILDEFLKKKLEKKRVMMERHHQKQLWKIQQHFQEKMQKINDKTQQHLDQVVMTTLKSYKENQYHKEGQQ